MPRDPQASGGPDAVSEGTDRHLEALQKGYLGDNPVADVIPNSHYALTSGPEGVPLHVEHAVAAGTFAPSYDEAYPGVPVAHSVAPLEPLPSGEPDQGDSGVSADTTGAQA